MINGKWLINSSFFVLHSSFSCSSFFPRPAQVQQETTEKGGKLPNKEFPPLHIYNNKVY